MLTTILTLLGQLFVIVPEAVSAVEALIAAFKGGQVTSSSPITPEVIALTAAAEARLEAALKARGESVP